MIDTHAHLYFDRFDDDRAEVIERARAAGVDRIIDIGIDVPSSRQSIELARAHDGLYAAVGLHPTSILPDLAAALDEIRALALAFPREVVAIGEFGLDYYWDDVSPEDQAPRLAAQLDLALELGLPVVFHCRDALEDLLAALEARPSLPPGVFHCFSGGPDEARRALDLGYHVSFAGNVTFRKAVELQESARFVPADRLLLETDCPFLAPEPRRGKRNEPAYVAHSCAFLAELRGTTTAELDRRTTENAEALFRLT